MKRLNGLAQESETSFWLQLVTSRTCHQYYSCFFWGERQKLILNTEIIITHYHILVSNHYEGFIIRFQFSSDLKFNELACHKKPSLLSHSQINWVHLCLLEKKCMKWAEFHCFWRNISVHIKMYSCSYYMISRKY